MKTIVISIVMVLFFLSDNPDAIIGKWNTKNNEAIVEMFKSENKYYAKIISLKTPNDANGKPRKDCKNKEAKSKDRNLQGILILWNMAYSAKEKNWKGGNVYDPDMGHTAECIITLIDNNTIKVKGFVGFEWVSQSQIWKRKTD